MFHTGDTEQYYATPAVRWELELVSSCAIHTRGARAFYLRDNFTTIVESCGEGKRPAATTVDETRGTCTRIFSFT